MTIQDFLSIIYANRELLGDPTEKMNPEDTHPMACHKGCPLRVAFMVYTPHLTWGPRLFMRENGESIGINPCPLEAAYYLRLEDTFTMALANGWDIGIFYGDTEEFELEFSGFLIGFTLRPAPLQLTA